MSRIERLTVTACTIPTDAPEADGTLAWASTTIVVVEAFADGRCGLGYTYADAAAAGLVRRVLAPLVVGGDPFAVREHWSALQRAVRNAGAAGIAATAISAVDAALWDLAARLAGVPLCDLLGRARDRVPVYGSGGFTSYDDDQLTAQLEAFRSLGVHAVKIKVGASPGDDPRRVALARETIGDELSLFVDANGAFGVPEAIAFAARIAGAGVSWFEEPVSSDDVDGLGRVRDHAPPGMAIAAGEYGWSPRHQLTLLQAGAVDVVQADATRCLGITGLLAAGAIADAFGVPLSAHCAPALHLHPACALPRLAHVEWFHDHARVEQMLFDGVQQVRDGAFAPDRERVGNGLSLRHDVAHRHAVPSIGDEEQT
jgi:L-alanine-DL-glutamate epimerase-like enolase superfamily enzyme